ncbi:MAG: regulatory protein RecX [Candidatus Omnitrophota bacterium]
MKNQRIDALQKARNYAFLLLKFRLRSEKELAERLKRKKFEPRVISETLAFLKEKRFLDDRLFAKTWIEWRIAKPLGVIRLRQELRAKGIDKEIIDETLEEVKKNYSEESVVSGLAKERFKKLKGVERNKAKQRILGYLLRRGFSTDLVIEAIRRL